MSKLIDKICIPCHGGIPPLKGSKLNYLEQNLGNKWNVTNEHHLEKEWKFKNFKTAVAFTNKIADLAEEQGHHPDIYLAWGKVDVKIWTHKIDGLSESDFILAEKIDIIFNQFFSKSLKA